MGTRPPACQGIAIAPQSDAHAWHCTLHWMVRLLSYAGRLKGILRHVMNATVTASDLTSSGRDVIEVLRSRRSLPAKMAYIALLALNGMDSRRFIDETAENHVSSDCEKLRRILSPELSEFVTTLLIVIKNRTSYESVISVL